MRRKSVVNTDFKCTPKLPLSVTSSYIQKWMSPGLAKGHLYRSTSSPRNTPQRGILHRQTTGFVKLNVTLTSHGTLNIAWKQLQCLYM